MHENGAAGERLLPETMGGGVGVLDYDSDDDMDLLFVNSSHWPWEVRSDAPATCALFENDGTGRFSDVSSEAGINISLYGMGCAIGDYDNDGDPDIYLSAVGENRLLHNDNGRFIDVTRDAGVAGPADAWSTSCGWFDYDRDGRLDLFVCNYIVWSRELDLAQHFRLVGSGSRAYGRPQSFEGTLPLLFHNKGDGTFEEVAGTAGLHVRHPDLHVPLAKSLGLTFADFDRDADLDVIVANDTVRNFLFENRGDGTFQEIGRDAGIAFDPSGEVRGAMGVDSATFRDGGAVAVAIGNFANEMTAFYVTRAGEMAFTDEAVSNGLGPASRKELSFGLIMADFDLDGRIDLFTTNGHLEPDIQRVLPSQRFAQRPHLFWNCGSDQVVEFCALSPEQVGEAFFQPIVGRGAASADFDADGDVDLVIATAGRPPRLLRNDLPGRRRWCRLKLVGSRSNRDAIGALVAVKENGERQFQAVMPTRSYLSQVEPVLTFGFGVGEPSERLDEVAITWPSGGTTRIGDLELGQVHTIEEPRSDTPKPE